MKRLLIILLVVLVVLGIVAQFLLPKLVEQKIQAKIEETFKPSQVTVKVNASPAIKMLWGSVDSIEANLEEVKLKNDLTLSTADMNLKGVTFSVKEMLSGGIFTPQSVEDGFLDLSLSAKNLSDYMDKNVKGLDHVSVAFDNDKMKLNGHFNIGGIIEGEASTNGLVIIKNNTLIYGPENFSINGFSIRGINMPVMKEISIYNFSDFPIPVTASSVKTADGKVKVHLKTKSE